MAIWFNQSLGISDLNPLSKDTMAEFIGIEFIEIGENYIKAKMPVNNRTRQPYGLLHGGASVALAETVGSVGSAHAIDQSRFYCVGIEINANHIRGVKEGFVYATAIPFHLGGTTHVWDIKIYNDENKLVCVSRLTVAILRRKETLPE
jgi:1,4-dihydroxy-2-naphthoyl-CoA hydrolase